MNAKYNVEGKFLMPIDQRFYIISFKARLLETKPIFFLIQFIFTCVIIECKKCTQYDMEIQ